MLDREEMAKAVVHVLEPNLQFFRRSPDDRNRYLVGPEALKAISWVITTIVIPVLLCGINEAVKNRVTDWFQRQKDQHEPSVKPPESIEQEVATILESRRGIVISNDKVSEAVQVVREYLSYRGWPKAFANSDAEQIVEVIRHRIGKKP